MLQTQSPETSSEKSKQTNELVKKEAGQGREKILLLTSSFSGDVICLFLPQFSSAATSVPRRKVFTASVSEDKADLVSGHQMDWSLGLRKLSTLNLYFHYRPSLQNMTLGTSLHTHVQHKVCMNEYIDNYHRQGFVLRGTKDLKNRICCSCLPHFESSLTYV